MPFAGLFLAVLIMLPFVIQLSHALHHNKHMVCSVMNQDHIHKTDLDCVFHKYNTRQHYTFTTIDFTLIKPKMALAQYTFTKPLVAKKIRISTAYRGPPVV